MTWPITFAGLPSPQQLSDFDVMFQQVAAISSIPSTATGANAISLLPVINCPTLAAYTELCGFRFRAAGNSTGLVTLQFSGLGFLPVYLADGVTQANVGSVLAGVEYVATFSQSLNSGSGGFFLEAPAVPVASQSTTFAPGGRLTVQSGVPVMNASQSAQTTLYYAPYIHSFCPIYNGSIIVMQQFTSGLSDTVRLTFAMGVAPANWPAGSVFDVFITLQSGLPVLCTVNWASLTSRNVLLAIFGGFLTNSTVTGARLAGTGGIISVAANQGTYLGTFATIGRVPAQADGQINFVFGTAASGGGPSCLGLFNYYNRALFSTRVSDNGATYTYTSNVIREARGASGTQEILWVTGAADLASMFVYTFGTNMVASATANLSCGIGFDSTSSYSQFIFHENPASVTTQVGYGSPVLVVAALGVHFAAALEASDSLNPNTFNRSFANNLHGALWL